MAAKSLTFLAFLSIAAIASALEGPCDILGAAGNPCVAAHSTVRALYAKYAGPLYTVFHAQSNKSADISTLEPGGFADVQQHEAICPNEGVCVIARVVDQSGNGNHLTPRDDRGVPQRHSGNQSFGHLHNPVDASKHKIYVGGDNTPVYGMYFDPGMGYNNNRTKGVATGDGECILSHAISGSYTISLAVFSSNHRSRDHVRCDDRQAVGQQLLLRLRQLRGRR
jgi:hypothetical protein